MAVTKTGGASLVLSVLAIILATTLPLRAEPVHHGVAAGLLKVTQVPGIDDNTNATVTLPISVNNFQLGTWNRADLSLRIGVGADASADVERGVLVTAVAQNGRNNFGTNGYPTSAMAANANGSYRIVSFVGTGGGAGSAAEYNVDVAGAWFPYDRYFAGFARNSQDANGGANDLFTGSPGLVLGTHFKSVGTGKSIVDLRGFGIDSRTDGILLVTHAKDENNFALSQPNSSDGTWNVFLRDNAQPTFATYEQDPVAFVFIPKTNTALISGRFLGDGSAQMFSGSTPRFSVVSLAAGRWELRIPGHSPATGVLMISPEGGGSGNGDNIVNYQPNTAGDAWEIQSRDTPVCGLQALGTEPVASFVFIPAPTPGFTVSPTNGLTTVGRGGKATFSISLHSRPTAEVNVNVSSSNPSKGIPTPAKLKFSSNSWHVAQTVTVTGADSQETSNSLYSIVLSPAASTDAGYSGLDPSDVSVQFVAPRAIPVFPLPQGTNVGLSADFKLTVTNSAAQNLSVTVFGREARDLGEDFTIVVLPDTQMYTGEKSGGKKEMFISQVEWIITNRVARNIAYVTQLGDIVNDGDIFNGVPNLTQWRNATNAMYRQEDPVRTQLPYGIPYGVAVGNHEMEPIGDPTGTTLFYNQYFGVQHFAGRSYYAGHYGTNNNNHFDFFSAGGLDFVVIYFEYYNSGDPAALAWANQVLKTNAHRRAIVVTHNMGNAQTPATLSPQGAAIYDALKTNANFFMALGGHISGEGSRQDIFNGNIVRTFVQDYQGRINGGNGLLRLLEFSPSNNVVVAQTYSPWTRQYETDEDSEFYFEYNMQPGGTAPAPSFVALATNTGVATDTLLRYDWPGLQPGKSYEWYVIVTDAAGGAVTSPTWRFKTAAVNTAPSVANLSLTITGDSSTNLTLTATDINGDRLTFEIPTSPTRGLLQNVDVDAGTVTYMPAHGFRGSDRFTFRANDGQSSSTTASMNLNVVAPPDTDGNGLPNPWETAYGLSDPNADADEDGQSNLAEFVANTNPTNAASILKILNATRQTNGFFDLAWSAVGGVRYRVEFSNGDTNSGAASPFVEIVRDLISEINSTAVGQASSQTFRDDLTRTGAPTNNARYFRVKVVQ